MGPSGKCILALHRTFRSLRSSAERRRHVQAMPCKTWLGSDGSKALRKAVQATSDKAALVQRCQLYKLRNVMDYLPERQRPWVQAMRVPEILTPILPEV